MPTITTYKCDGCGNEQSSKEGWLEIRCYDATKTLSSYPSSIFDFIFCPNCNCSTHVKESTKTGLKTFFKGKKK